MGPAGQQRPPVPSSSVHHQRQRVSDIVEPDHWHTCSAAEDGKAVRVRIGPDGHFNRVHEDVAGLRSRATQDEPVSGLTGRQRAQQRICARVHLLYRDGPMGAVDFGSSAAVPRPPPSSSTVRSRPGPHHEQDQQTPTACRALRSVAARTASAARQRPTHPDQLQRGTGAVRQTPDSHGLGVAVLLPGCLDAGGHVGGDQPGGDPYAGTWRMAPSV